MVVRSIFLSLINSCTGYYKLDTPEYKYINKNNVTLYKFNKGFVGDSIATENYSTENRYTVLGFTARDFFQQNYYSILYKGKQVYIQREGLSSLCVLCVLLEDELSNEVIVDSKQLNQYWQRAIEFVAKNAYTAIHQQTDNLIQTADRIIKSEGTIESYPSGFSITKVQISEQTYRITIGVLTTGAKMNTKY